MEGEEKYKFKKPVQPPIAPPYSFYHNRKHTEKDAEGFKKNMEGLNSRNESQYYKKLCENAEKATEQEEKLRKAFLTFTEETTKDIPATDFNHFFDRVQPRFQDFVDMAIDLRMKDSYQKTLVDISLKDFMDGASAYEEAINNVKCSKPIVKTENQDLCDAFERELNLATKSKETLDLDPELFNADCTCTDVAL